MILPPHSNSIPRIGEDSSSLAKHQLLQNMRAGEEVGDSVYKLGLGENKRKTGKALGVGNKPVFKKSSIPR